MGVDYVLTEYQFVPTSNEAPAFHEYPDPYWKMIIHRIDWEQSQYFYLQNWNRSETDLYNMTWFNDPYIGLHTSYTTSNSAHLNRNITIPADGWYWILLRVMKHPQNSGYVQLSIDDINIEDPIYLYSPNEHSERYMYHLIYLTSGTRDFDLYMTKQSFVESIMIYKIDKYIAQKDGSVYERDAIEINLDNVEITSNSENDPGTLVAKIPYEYNLKDNYNRSGYKFDFCDPITFLLGQDKKNMQPVFGGYVLYPKMDGMYLELNCMDRLLDTKIQMVYRNMNIGKSDEETSNKLPVSNFTNVYEMVRYLGSILEYPLNVETINESYGFKKDFGSTDEYNSISVTNLVSSHDFDIGNPKPSLQLKPGASAAAFKATLYNDSIGYDANIYNYFFMDYSNYTTNKFPPLPFNIQFSMHQEGETVSDDVVYELQVSGGTPVSNSIGSVGAVWNDRWPGLKVDLKKAFEKQTGSGQYWVTNIDLVGTLDSARTVTPNDYKLWIDNVMSYKSVNNNPHVQSSDVRYIYDIFKEMYEGTKHIIYIRPGLERPDDVLICTPENTLLSSASIEETVNLRSFDDEHYDPQGDGLCNQRDVKFTIGETTEGHSYSQDIDSAWRYKAIRTYEDLSVNNQVDADKITEDYITNNSYKDRGYTVILDGNVLFEPAQYVVSRISSKHIQGNHNIKNITQTLDITKNDFSTKLEMIHTTKHYKSKRQWLDRALSSLGIHNTNSVYGGVRL